MSPDANVAVVGSHSRLGEWNTEKAAPATSIDKKVWSALVQLPISEFNGAIEFKAIVKYPDGYVEWYVGANLVQGN